LHRTPSADQHKITADAYHQKGGSKCQTKSRLQIPTQKRRSAPRPKTARNPSSPFLGIVPIPTLSVDQGAIRFKLDVKPRADGTAGQDTGKGRESTFSKGPLSAAASGYVTVKPSASDIPAIEQADEAD